jgi:uncharacterized protein
MNVERLIFSVDGTAVVGNLHLPETPGPHRAVVVAGPMTSVKEQVTGIYAAALAQRGVAALAIDHRHYGESGGEPRQYEVASRKIDDLKIAVDVLGQHPAIDRNRLGLAAVCLGSGYAAWASIDHPLVRRLAMVVGYYRDPVAMRANDPAGFDAKVAEGRAAREAYEANGQAETIPAAATNGDAAMTTADTTDYYTRRAVVPNYRNEFAVMSREHFLPFDVQAAAPLLSVPVLMVHSENGLSPAWARKFHEAVRAPKHMEWIESHGQTDVYDDPAIVGHVADMFAGHFAVD